MVPGCRLVHFKCCYALQGRPCFVEWWGRSCTGVCGEDQGRDTEAGGSEAAPRRVLCGLRCVTCAFVLPAVVQAENMSRRQGQCHCIALL